VPGVFPKEHTPVLFTTSSWKHLAGQNDVQPTLHVPVIYENVPTSLPQWEYRVISVDTREQKPLDEASLNESGTQGWLLVNVQEERSAEAGTRLHYYFVRQKEA
jgi:hypothetical protein